MMAGVVLGMLGLLAIVMPVVTTQQTTDIARIGELRITANEQTSHVVPPFAGPAVLAFGVVLIGAAFVMRR